MVDWVSSSVIHSELCLLKVSSSSESEDAGGDKRMLRLTLNSPSLFQCKHTTVCSAI